MRERSHEGATDLPRADSFSRLLDAAGPTEMPTLTSRRPTATVHCYRHAKTRMAR